MLARDVRDPLLAYRAFDDREASFRERMLALCDAPEPFSRDAFSPGHFTASAFVLGPDRRQVLLIHHKKLGRWLQPGGHIEPTDTNIAGAARREVQEETGLQDTELLLSGLFDIDVHAIPARPGEPAHEHFDLRVLLAAPGLGVVASDEVAGARWVALEELDGVATDDSVRRIVRKLAALGLDEPAAPGG